ncbi:MAG: type I restriction enzyme HsdR N-terminal domain-containing protein [Planctomycetota bacterium]
MNEENTKASRIDPLLRALGWNVEDADEVQREFKHKPRDKPVDYALVDRGVRLFVEAKALGMNLDDHRWTRQIIGYASVAGVRWIVLTDGNEYHIYNASAEVVVEKKLFRKVKITEDNAAETLLLLAKDALKGTAIDDLWRAEFIDSQVKDAIEGLFAGDAKVLATYVAKATKNLTAAEIRSSIGRCRVQIDFPGVGAPLPDYKEKKAKQRTSKRAENQGGNDLLALIESGVLRPPVTLSRTYKGKNLSGTVLGNGKVRVGSVDHESLSRAAVAVIASMTGKEQPTNGWDFWRVEHQGSLVPIGNLRALVDGGGRKT